MQLMKLADAIDTRLEEQAPLFRLELLALLVSLFQCCWMVDQLPHAVRGLMMNRKLSYVESSALSALLERKLSEPVYPQDERTQPSDLPKRHKRSSASV